MNKKLTLLLLLISSNIFAVSSISTGNIIKANDLKNSTLTIGDIKQSLLPVINFQQLHGDCWVAMEGQSITGSDFSSLTGVSNLPDARGKFLRNLGGNSASLMQTQNSATKMPINPFITSQAGSHQHDFVFERLSDNAVGSPPYQYLGSSGSNVLEVRSGGDRTVVNSVRPSGNHTHQITGGDLETRPENLTVNFFIKINHTCN